MDRFKQFCASLVLAITLALSASAGEMDGGRASQMDPRKTNGIQTVTASQLETERTLTPKEIALNLLFGLLSLI